MAVAKAPQKVSRGKTKQRMLYAAVELMAERSAAGVTVDEVIARSGAPRGSVYYYFPAGRAQLISEALDLAGQITATTITEAFAAGPGGGVDHYVNFWIEILQDKNFGASCPIASAAIGGGEIDSSLIPQADAIFQSWQDLIMAGLSDMGFPRERAGGLATLIVSAIEGGLILARANRDTAPLEKVQAELNQLLEQALNAR
ncbi:putative HTH-type transcriptional regulator YxaF [Mycobacteroides salmoniphilum]|uniref:Putative HTH-type transcriptional regulator YxaF n=1 Tax=Mycobacteroides salmoniphilum TaxID=404941 RepID=A0A4R8RVQ1_9MYCO|nr:TetR/AcrR family transcriptional regulator [Mycobacteroides salmoniphilum]TDZ78547.1 putative HTH-type transcriptional regulator YxaF [Mycobacteroides salmoniphilum]